MQGRSIDSLTDVMMMLHWQELGEHGKPAFYQGRVAQAIVDVINQNGGVMTLDDLSSHESEVITPISTEYKVREWSAASHALYLYLDNMSEGMTPLCPGCSSVGAPTQQSGIGCPVASQHPGELPSQRYSLDIW